MFIQINFNAKKIELLPIFSNIINECVKKFDYLKSKMKLKSAEDY